MNLMEMLQIALTAILGWFAFNVAKRQAQIAAETLRFRLYERRLRVYVSLRRFLREVREARPLEIGSKGPVLPEEDVAEALFLFDKAMGEFLRELEMRGRRYRQDLGYRERYEAEGREAALASAEASLDIDFRWLVEAEESLEDQFAPFLGFQPPKRT